MRYVPRPIDTAGVSLPPQLSALVEALAEHTHDVWAQERLDQGWTFGDTRDDGLRRHPCLVPYDRLPESEKRIDRRMAIETLRATLVLGYRIEPPA
ncbi:RyR domain-containing protein [Solirubrobacter soli]|uniref:RyR domain-containing protein n=1 Tax=Solirubrobacter soli TaxID=363832 RepID=UPI00041457D1